MTTTRSYTNAFEIVDYTEELQLVPPSWTLLNDSALFSEEFLSTNTVTFEENNKTLGLIVDQFRGAKPQANKDDNRKIRAYNISHWPTVDAVKPEDIQGKKAYGSMDTAETEAAVIARKMERIRRNLDVTLEVGRWSLLTTGNLYSPGGTNTGNIYSDFGITQTSVDFALNVTTTDIISKVEAVISSMQDNSNTSDIISGVTAYCSPEFFGKLISHAKVTDAYKYFSAIEGQQITRNRAGGNMGLYREFSYGGIRFVEVRTVLAGQRLIPAGDAVFVPSGTSDVFMSYYGPCNRMDFVNTVAERAYLFAYRDPKGGGIDLDAEMNVTSIVRRPQLVIRGFTA